MTHCLSCAAFFFSSRRRHTRLQGDWSSDVCSSELGVEGLKARLDASLTPRSVVRLSFTPPDAGSAITVMSLVIRADPDGHAFAFVHLPEADTERLRDLIRRRPSR